MCSFKIYGDGNSLFFVVFFLSARNMAVAKETQEVRNDQVLTETENNGEPNIKVDELVSMDYSPATRKPPIHN